MVVRCGALAGAVGLLWLPHVADAQGAGFPALVVSNVKPAAAEVVTVSGSGCGGDVVHLRLRKYPSPGHPADFHSNDDMIPVADDGTWTGHVRVRDDATPGMILGVAAKCEWNHLEAGYPVTAVEISATAPNPQQILTISPDGPYWVGQEVTISGGGCEPGSEVVAGFGSTTVSAAVVVNAIVGGDGRWSGIGTIRDRAGGRRYLATASCGAPGLAAEGVTQQFRRFYVRVEDGPPPTTTTTTTSPLTAVTRPPAGPTDAAPPAAPMPGGAAFTG